MQCEISFPSINKSNKKEKNKDKAHKNKESHRKTEDVSIIDGNKDSKKNIIDAVEEEIEPKPKKRVKVDKG